MNYKIINYQDVETWDQIVKSFAKYEIYYLNGYSRAFHLIGDGEPCLFYCEKNGTRAFNVFMKRDIAEVECCKGMIETEKYFDVATPYGYGGFLVEGIDFQFVQESFEEYCQNEGIISEFVRFNPMLENWKGLEQLYDETYWGNTIYMDLTSPEIIWANLTSKNRNMIRKAQKAGLKTYWGRDENLIEPFMEIYNQTMKKDDASEYYFFGNEFYKSILEDLKQNALWFYTKLNGEIASISIFLFANHNMHYHLSASCAEYQNLAPTNLLLYEAAMWGCQNGFNRLHMGGGVGAQEDNLYKFKKAFNRYDDSQFYIGKRIYNANLYSWLVDLRKNNSKKAIRENFFPEYRG